MPVGLSVKSLLLGATVSCIIYDLALIDSSNSSDTITCPRPDVCGLMHNMCCPCKQLTCGKCKELRIITAQNEKEGECPTGVISPTCLI